ncbi:hypothetical protein FNV43_RR16591 [Rhamnella rubrinervis]|uniref:Dirigent protein n=1 Tax=Rhamnella rubrinervis TaxID=2594499 RepID=A0A8K0GZ38_9ROSA|nr:hypothetical protein FNV43_RR16591 [Rhamnella rubrinervis]
MAKAVANLTTIFLTSSAIFFSILVMHANATEKSYSFSRTLPPQSLGLKREKLTHLHFFFHDVTTGTNTTNAVVAMAQSTNASATVFGEVVMVDDPLTVGPEKSSKPVGRAQGIYASASKSEISFLMVLNLVFSEGEYNGSTISILGRNSIFTPLREMPIVGGSGKFKFARGYAHASNYDFNVTKSLNAVVEYDVYVLHY